VIREALIWLATPCSTAARWEGHLADAISLQQRAARCRIAWASHIEHCHKAVRASIETCDRHRTALILGSGLALEYPLAEIATRFRRVVLADAVHLLPLRRLARQYPNVELHGCDLTAGIPAIDDVDWVVSCNLLSQLPLIPLQRMRRRRSNIRDEVLEAHGREIMARHLDQLGAIGASRCLIADAEQSLRDRSGNLVEHSDYAGVLDLDRHAYSTWEWNIAPAGELPDGLSAMHRVVACHWPARQEA
jgi:hypothetical protein